ncbi:hypothetical protein PIB30_074987, partial [Stylosanthes scabra]|nr:hypothetical protein [Stylosanthes scabra]
IGGTGRLRLRLKILITFYPKIPPFNICYSCTAPFHHHCVSITTTTTSNHNFVHLSCPSPQNHSPTSPSLAVAAARKSMKKKGQTLSLIEFIAVAVKPDYQDPIVLPNVPRQRTAEELDRDGNRLGGEFRNYSSNSPNKSSGGGDNSSNSRWVLLGFLTSRGKTLGLGI